MPNIQLSEMISTYWYKTCCLDAPDMYTDSLSTPS